MSSRRLEGWDINLQLINAIKGKMIHKWVLLNLFITFIIILVVGFSIKEFACYQFNVFSNSPSQSEQFRQTIETYLLYASALAFILAIVVHLFFARKILQPLGKLTRVSDQITELRAIDVTSKDEVGKITNDIISISKKLNDMQKQKDQMMADIAHELRTPLTTLNGYLDGLEDGVISKDEATTAILKSECERLIQFIEKINELYSWERKELTDSELSIEPFIRAVLLDYETQFEQANLRLQVDIEQAQLLSDPKALRVIFQELLDNALYYTVGQQVWIEGRNSNGQYLISVSNEGRPIQEKSKEQLFERFYRVDPSRNRNTGGAGLGLAIAKQIVLRLGGDIGYRSNDGKHTFWFSVPC